MNLWQDPKDSLGEYEPRWAKVVFVFALLILIGLVVVRWTDTRRNLDWLNWVALAWLVWFLGFGLVIGVVAAKRRDRKRKLAMMICPTCGYDLRATPERCPECGTVPQR